MSESGVSSVLEYVARKESCEMNLKTVLVFEYGFIYLFGFVNFWGNIFWEFIG